MAKYLYLAIFTSEGELFSVAFPDLKSCYTHGKGLQDAYNMASDIPCLTLYNLEEEKAKIPNASKISEIEVKEGEFVTLVSCDTLEYRQYYNNKAVKKTLSIPVWLNIMAEREGINFSSVLQAALKRELKIVDR